MKQQVSIITINLNNKAGLLKTMQSVLSQSYSSIEYIVIDGGSTDGSYEILQEHKKDLFYWVSEADSGIYNAMNKGIVKATGDYILFLNSGDYLYTPTSIETVFKNGQEAAIIYGYLQTVLKDTKNIKKYPSTLTVEYLLSNSLPHPATFYRRQLFEEYGLYDESLKIVGDWAFNLKVLAFHDVSYVCITEVLSVFDLEGISSQAEQKKLIKKEGQEVIKKLLGTRMGTFFLELLELKKTVNKKNKGILTFLKLKM